TSDFAAVSGLSSFSLRLDANLSPRHRLFGRINLGSSSGDFLDPAAQVPATLLSSIESARARTGTIALNSTLSCLTNELKFNASVNRGSRTNASRLGAGTLPLDLFLPAGASNSPLSAGNDTYLALVFPSLAGTISTGLVAANSQTQWQMADTLALSRGRHE